MASKPPSWLKYANFNAVRNDPLSPELLAMFETFMPELGLGMEVFSGGQEAEGPDRVGSHRHDHGGAGDFFFTKDGRRLSYDNPDDLPLIQQAITRGRKAGITGWGAGAGYMQPGSIHGGLGTPGTWGAMGKSENTPEWLKKAYDAAGEMQQAGYTPEQIQKAFLDTIAGPESGGAYDVMYGGNKFTDYSKHPGVYTTIDKGPNKGKKSSAAGRYQFLESTWNDIAGRHMLSDFSPENQDKGAWELAEETYAQKTGGKGNLIDALQSNDPARINAAADLLKGVWTSMPGGIETQGYGGKTFSDVYNQNLGANPTTGGMVTGSTSPSPGFTPAAEEKPKWKPPEKSGWEAFGDAFGEGIGSMGKMEAPAPAVLKDATQGAPGLAATAGVTYDEEAKNERRQKLARAMAQLNSGKLWA